MLSVARGTSRRCKAKHQQAVAPPGCEACRRFILETSQLVPNVATIMVQQPLSGTVGNILGCWAVALQGSRSSAV